MKRIGIISIIIYCLTLFSCGEAKDEMQDVVELGLQRSAVQSKAMAQKLLDDKTKLPRTIGKDGEFVTSDAKWWTSGFFPGVLWYLYEGLNDDAIKEFAHDYTMRVENEKYTTSNHDVGFMLYCSFGNGYRLTLNKDYKDVLLLGAESLSTRYSPITKTIRSWDWNTKVWKYPVIIDNMMNLELLEWASKNSDSTKYSLIATSHADTSMKNHFRDDYSSYHLVDYDPETGEVRLKQTVQGYANESSWARGQGWALYGYTVMYRETQDVKYLKQAENIGNFIMNHPNLPEDKVPYWDFDAPDIPNALRDVSAGSLMASAYIELSTLTKDKELSNRYLDLAKQQLKSLTSPAYLAEAGTNHDFILKHSVGNLPGKSEVDVPLTYADYYYVEALVRYKNLMLKK